MSAGQKQAAKKELGSIGRRDLTKGSLDFYSPQRELEMGREMARQIEMLVRMDEDPGLNRYVQNLTDLIVRHSDAKLPIRARVIDSNEVNAFVLPGGFLYITTGMILKTHSEAELAAVIAHEVAHVAARDITRQMTKTQIWNWMSVPLLFVGGPVAYGVQQSMMVGGPLTLMLFSRRAERAADFHGLQYLYKAGYDPVASIAFFERVKKLEKDPQSPIARAFSSHPLTKDRVKAAERHLRRDLPARDEYVVTTSRYQQEKAKLEQILRDEMPLIPAKPKEPVLKDGAGGKHSRSEDQP
jgi:predicted Zn-dependent protease